MFTSIHWLKLGTISHNKTFSGTWIFLVHIYCEKYFPYMTILEGFQTNLVILVTCLCSKTFLGTLRCSEKVTFSWWKIIRCRYNAYSKIFFRKVIPLNFLKQSLSKCFEHFFAEIEDWICRLKPVQTLWMDWDVKSQPEIWVEFDRKAAIFLGGLTVAISLCNI